ncbi:hypothetical protein GN157_15070 [Flavobacterium rakeshii]|uniref:Uncharacterized protein n=1 Tax=Flavobacterium rakeshii TaxID=1038845 RepID=A0A6N8HH10_9FLAO|nr:hypothetical protein [Flavobacterium rakeshii]MUV05037.1 hypothetical protein [Flavobacterium rakeshii]
MTGSDLLSKIILSLNIYFDLNDDEVIDFINVDEDIEKAIDKLLNIDDLSDNFEIFLNSLKIINRENREDFLNTPYALSGDVNIIDFSQPNLIRKNRSFAYSDTNFGYFSSKVLFNVNSLIDLSSLENSFIWKQIEEFLVINYDNNQNNDLLLFDTIKATDKTKGLVNNKNMVDFQEEKHYPYIYLCYLNSSKSIILPQDLTYTPPSLSTFFNYVNNNNYEQFFDIYDVINELNQAPDILNRFLRLYHILEYLVYRVYLVNLVSRLNDNKFFVREFIISAEKMKKEEKISFLNNFVSIFSVDTTSINSELNAVINQQIIDFLKEKNIVKGLALINNNMKKIAELIYGLRCCIVHNKESEYHITVSNHDDYALIIPIIKTILRVFEDLIIKKMVNSQTEITYDRANVDLF